MNEQETKELLHFIKYLNAEVENLKQVCDEFIQDICNKNNIEIPCRRSGEDRRRKWNRT